MRICEEGEGRDLHWGRAGHSSILSHTIVYTMVFPVIVQKFATSRLVCRIPSEANIDVSTRCYGTICPAWLGPWLECTEMLSVGVMSIIDHPPNLFLVIVQHIRILRLTASRCFQALRSGFHRSGRKRTQQTSSPQVPAIIAATCSLFSYPASSSLSQRWQSTPSPPSPLLITSTPPSTISPSPPIPSTLLTPATG